MLSREDILQEIRKTAKENGGIPLGLQRLKSKTGIATYDWMRFWPRFSDALKEAGFRPNELTPAYNTSVLFEMYIALVKKKKKLPVRGDLIVEANENSKFPSHSTFERFGSKQKLITELLKYAEDKNYKDIVKLCNAEIAKTTNIESQDEDSSAVMPIGSVYLAKSGRYYKIGRTNSLGRRHHEITILLPESFTLIHEIKTDDPSGIEAYWHRRFEPKRKMGEWFDLNSSDVKAFKRWRRIA
ncbi:MAG: GIY-YIG nuclease family protein [Candidatus Levybacteria bacterium]|nr:GIY-YIG nuclease family protein [Candidatus Levybacteria bacterium]